ncbi:hypothetical protein [Tropicimonas sp. IMCC34043]|uniref:hypothetical protein n=1 Tax=Tropicimonas sp. IMCC34043 TaxID=2248760 RepID=UPI0013002F14|nr:hypothetical protein [Tropicimonas sp. IMCC34043]
MSESAGTAPFAGTAPVLASFPAHRGTYIRAQITLAVLGSIFATSALAFLGSGPLWVGPLGAGMAMAVRGVYLASEELGRTWDLTATGLRCTDGRTIALRDIAKVNRLGSAVQLVTRGGDKHLMKYLEDSDRARRRIEAALPGALA